MARGLTWSYTVALMDAHDLARDDDFLSYVLVDTVGTEKSLGVHKMGWLEQLPQHDPEEIIQIIRKHVIIQAGGNRHAASSKVSSAVDALLRLKFVQRYLKRKTTKQINCFATHASRYFELYLPTGTIEIAPTTRYTWKTGKTELCILATVPLIPGQVIKELKGSLADLSPEQDEDLRRGGIGSDFSVIHSKQKRCNQLFLGPARFVNHDCKPNSELIRDGRYITFRVQTPISLGQEVTAWYGQDYFGENNCDCLCESCERSGSGGYAPKAPARRGSEDAEEDDPRGKRTKAAKRPLTYEEKRLIEDHNMAIEAGPSEPRLTRRGTSFGRPMSEPEESDDSEEETQEAGSSKAADRSPRTRRQSRNPSPSPHKDRVPPSLTSSLTSLSDARSPGQRSRTNSANSQNMVDSMLVDSMLTTVHSDEKDDGSTHSPSTGNSRPSLRSSRSTRRRNSDSISVPSASGSISLPTPPAEDEDETTSPRRSLRHKSTESGPAPQSQSKKRLLSERIQQPTPPLSDTPKKADASSEVVNPRRLRKPLRESVTSAKDVPAIPDPEPEKENSPEPSRMVLRQRRSLPNFASLHGAVSKEATPQQPDTPTKSHKGKGKQRTCKTCFKPQLQDETFTANQCARCVRHFSIFATTWPSRIAPGGPLVTESSPEPEQQPSRGRKARERSPSSEAEPPTRKRSHKRKATPDEDDEDDEEEDEEEQGEEDEEEEQSEEEEEEPPTKRRKTSRNDSNRGPGDLASRAARARARDRLRDKKQKDRARYRNGVPFVKKDRNPGGRPKTIASLVEAGVIKRGRGRPRKHWPKESQEKSAGEEEEEEPEVTHTSHKKAKVDRLPTESDVRRPNVKWTTIRSFPGQPPNPGFYARLRIYSSSGGYEEFVRSRKDAHGRRLPNIKIIPGDRSVTPSDVTVDEDDDDEDNQSVESAHPDFSQTWRTSTLYRVRAPDDCDYNSFTRSMATDGDTLDDVFDRATGNDYAKGDGFPRTKEFTMLGRPNPLFFAQQARFRKPLPLDDDEDEDEDEEAPPPASLTTAQTGSLGRVRFNTAPTSPIKLLDELDSDPTPQPSPKLPHSTIPPFLNALDQPTQSSLSNDETFSPRSEVVYRVQRTFDSSEPSDLELDDRHRLSPAPPKDPLYQALEVERQTDDDATGEESRYPSSAPSSDYEGDPPRRGSVQSSKHRRSRSSSYQRLLSWRKKSTTVLRTSSLQLSNENSRCPSGASDQTDTPRRSRLQRKPGSSPRQNGLSSEIKQPNEVSNLSRPASSPTTRTTLTPSQQPSLHLSHLLASTAKSGSEVSEASSLPSLSGVGSQSTSRSRSDFPITPQMLETTAGISKKRDRYADDIPTDGVSEACFTLKPVPDRLVKAEELSDMDISASSEVFSDMDLSDS